MSDHSELEPELPSKPTATIKRPYRRYFTTQDKALVTEYMTTFSDKQRQTLVIAQDHLKTSFDVIKSGGFISWFVKFAVESAKKGELVVCNTVADVEKGRCYVIRGNILIYEKERGTLFDAIAAKKIDCPVVDSV